ncbi:hypothetical protein C8T65DRAFT_837494 [Cerioporus squamosus]|nr:hypothetical protein C8T65DRAFT_837494 [Cerioporus squamosus]
MAQPRYQRRIIYGAPPRLQWPLQTVFAFWWSDEVLRENLRRIPEPKTDVVFNHHTQTLLKDQLRMLDRRIKQLEEQCRRLGHYSLEVEDTLYCTRVSRKLMVWRHFPIRQLPPEILTTIFQYVVWSVTGHSEGNYTRLSLTATCKQFREVAIADQSLWNCLWFRDVYPWRRSLTFLKRAGSSPLDVRFGGKVYGDHAGREYPAMTVNHLNYLLDALLPKISQIRILIASFESIELVEHFMKRFATAGPPTLLERYELHRTSLPLLWPLEKAALPIPLSIYPTPKLRWISLDSVSIDFSKLHRPQLQTLYIRRMCLQSCPTPEKFSEMLGGSLYKLAVEGAGPQCTQRTVASVRRTELPNLRELSIGDVSSVFSLNIFNYVHAPRLMALSLGQLGEQDYSQMLGMMTGMFPELQLLFLFSVDLPKSDETMRKAVLWLESMPRIKMLKIVSTKHFILDAFYQDPTQYWSPSQIDTYIRSWKKKNGDREVVRPVLLPNLEFLYFNTQAAGDEMSVLTTGRQAIGKPFKTAYTSDVHLPAIPPAELQKIKSSVATLEIMQGLMPPPTEVDIYRDIAGSVDKSLRIPIPNLYHPVKSVA